MQFNLLLKTQHFAIPLSVSITKPKILGASPFLRMIIKPGKSRKGEKPTSEKRRKIIGKKCRKLRGIEFFSRALEISKQLYCASSNYRFFTHNDSTVRCPCTTSRNRSKGPMNVLNSG